MIKNILNKVPKWWIVVIALGVTAALTTIGIRAFNGYTQSIQNEVVIECNTTKLEEDLKLEQEKNRIAAERMVVLQGLLAEAEGEVVEVDVFRDRIITEIREVQAEVVQTDEGAQREELSDTTKTFLLTLKERDNG